MNLSRWIEAMVTCNGRVLRPALRVDRVSDSDLPDLCIRMNLILDSIEYERCEGRLINLDIFDPVTSLLDELRSDREVQLKDWIKTINTFGEYYQLESMNVIEVAPRAVANIEKDAERLGIFLG
ncbi:hypothetical protein FYZ48_09975 [Gimesia chilikensis]|uniref:hypothetical protein n=1 Tax=Gimesia chilikensis TaxID=2605989 RepID=UPI0011EEFA6C|nr:hypothetical protein [Gimesia chilikensis]KAA0138978.1 hypothetical protein FYZ48_09975 [Gimesia chilikensis]